jgi:hypothetical protein
MSVPGRGLHFSGWELWESRLDFMLRANIVSQLIFESYHQRFINIIRYLFPKFLRELVCYPYPPFTCVEFSIHDHPFQVQKGVDKATAIRLRQFHELNVRKQLASYGVD